MSEKKLLADDVGSTELPVDFFTASQVAAATMTDPATPHARGAYPVTTVIDDPAYDQADEGSKPPN